jgi:hypothetical protein
MQEAAAHARGVVTVEDGGRDEKRERAGEAGLDPATPAMATSSSAKRAFPQHFASGCKYRVLHLSTLPSYYQISILTPTTYHFSNPRKPTSGVVCVTFYLLIFLTRPFEFDRLNRITIMMRGLN